MRCCSRKGEFSRREAVDSSWSWVLCILAAFCNALQFGISLSFGVMLPFLLDHFKGSIDETATAGSLAIAISFVSTFPAAKLTDYFGLRAISFVGALICVVSLLLTSLAKSIMIMYFTYSLGFGIGAGLLYTTSLFVSNIYFKRQRALAVGVICAGGGSGYLAFGPLIQLCLDEFGWASTCRLLAAAFVLPGLTSLFYGSENMTKNEETREDSDPLKETNHAKKKIVDWSVWKNSKYTVSTASMTLAGLAHYLPQIYLVGICETFGMTSTKSSQLLIFIGLATLIVRITVGILLNSLRVSTTFIFQFSQLVNSLVQLSIPFAYKYEHFIVISVFYGCADGAFTTSLNNILLNTVRPDQVSSAFGFGCIVNSLTIAAGAPLAGLLIKHTKSYNPAFFAGSVVLLISSLLPSVRHLVVALTARFARRPHSLDANVELCKEHKLQEVHLTEHYTVSQDLAISSVPQSLLVCNPTKVVRV